MTEERRLLAAGRDSEIFEHGPGLVLRRALRGRSLATEARVMEYVRSRGFPAPAVHDLGADGTEMVMDRIDGPTMLDALSRRPWTLAHHARVLADMHHRLHEIPAPEWMAPLLDGGGDRVIHLDLHPQNVLLSPDGPVLIDWTNAARGDGPTDVAMTWVLIGCSEIPAGAVRARLLGTFRQLFVSSFLGHFDRPAVIARLRPIVEIKEADPNVRPAELAAMERLADHEEGRLR